MSSRDPQPSPSSFPLIVCDFGYGLPKEERPRKERLLAIARQLVNFLQWQHQVLQPAMTSQEEDSRLTSPRTATLVVVGCMDKDITCALDTRMKDLWTKNNATNGFDKPFPSNFSILEMGLEEYLMENLSSATVEHNNKEDSSDSSDLRAVYLSPDAPTSLDPADPPPSVVVVGLLIDRRIQINRSLHRANALDLQTARWPLECIQCSANVDPNEPLKVDCILEANQQWHWNWENSVAQQRQKQGSAKSSYLVGTETAIDCCRRATVQALEHHRARHPERPLHKQP